MGASNFFRNFQPLFQNHRQTQDATIVMSTSQTSGWMLPRNTAGHDNESRTRNRTQTHRTRTDQNYTGSDPKLQVTDRNFQGPTEPENPNLLRKCVTSSNKKKLNSNTKNHSYKIKTS